MKLIKAQNCKWCKKVLPMLFALMLVIICVSACSSERESELVKTPIVPTMVSVPYSSEECIGMDADALETAFFTAGFSNVSVETIEDLTSAEAEMVGKVQAIKIGESASFSKEQQFEENTEIVIFRHDFKECILTVKVEFIPNLLFNKYDVDVLLDDELVGTMKHGIDGDFEISAYPGEYTMSFESVTTVAEGEISLSISWDAEVAYRITCWGDEIIITQLYIDEDIALDEGEIKLDKSANEYVSENYQSVASAFEKMGFTNVKCTPLYDIIWGITDEGEIEKVTIGGSTEYVRGDIFTKDTPVVITYHMPIEDDPTKARMVAESDDYKGDYYLDVQAELKSLGFSNIVLVEEKTSDLSKTNGEIITVLAANEEFYDGERLDKNIKIVITYWIIEENLNVQPEQNINPTTDVVLPSSGSKLDSDLDYISEYTACYVNVDGISNKPAIKKWNGATVVDSVAQYLDYLEDLGFAVEITSQTEKEPYEGYHYYETAFKVSKAEVSWTMNLMIQDEDYTEYQLDINL